MHNPVSTYRIQFHKEFSFSNFESLIHYFKKLGVSTIYASPVLAATSGSTHGYDGTDPDRINPEIGTLDQLRKISGQLKHNEIGWLQDIVPNHMAFHSENQWLTDVLEKGRLSVYAPFFDMTGTSELYQGKLGVPFLGSELADVIQAGELGIHYINNRLQFVYGDSSYPLNLRSYVKVLQAGSPDMLQSAEQLISLLKEMDESEDPRMFATQWNEFLLQLTSLVKNDEFNAFLKKRIADINQDQAELSYLADHQEYLLEYWRKSETEISYRRFFTVNGLICLNIQDEQVFERYHQFVKTLLEEGIVDGLRIDHIDGLYDPEKYLQKLRGDIGEDTYLIVEKILEKSEDLPVSWPIQGTSGYEFLAMANNIFTNQQAEKSFTEFYEKLTDNNEPIRAHLLKKKAEILYDHMGGELENLYNLFIKLQLAEPQKVEAAGKENLKKAIGELLVHCPVYRYYGNAMPLSETETHALKAVLAEVSEKHPELSSAVALLSETILENPVDGDEAYQAAALEFYQRCMQFSGPLMAKGGEDTLMYTYFRFIGHNDVGDFPDRFGVTTKAYHSYMQKRRTDWPLALNATSTHDTKRGEDVRARLNVLTDLPGEWLAEVETWRKLNQPLREGKTGPDANDEYLIYQTLVAAFPMPGEDEDNFASRFDDYLQKALREAKTNTNWAEPNAEYEQEVKDFARQLLRKDGEFWPRFSAFHSKVADHGIINSLAQLTLKFTSPGVPDVYQGCELWDFSLVDPDNRRPVDYQLREKWLSEFDDYDQDRLLEKLWENRNNAQVKLWLTSQLFHLRQKNPILFTTGEYISLKTRGTYKDHLLAFARREKKDFYVVVVPLHSARLCEEQQVSFFEIDWKDTSIVLPEKLSLEWQNVVTDETADFQGKLHPGEIFKGLPVAILKGSKLDNERKAGVLVHITSLASPFGIGDMGPEAYAFADFLEKSNQKLWQILPLNPIEKAQGYSPYSALSSRAGNPLLISLEELAKDGLLSPESLEPYRQQPLDRVDFETAEQIKSELLKKAYQYGSENADSGELEEFEAFCERNSEWLPDFALYMVLKEKHANEPWYEWPDEFRLRDPQALSEISRNQSDDIRFVQWQQYIFHKQWKALRAYCNNLEIKLLGDIPFYVSYDSADVWSHRELFRVDEHGKITGVAGVPPDAFSDDGQLWGMPVFDWETLKAQGYQWWIERLAKNIELFDLVRLDHFRAFADYWEVPGGENTAVNGEWKFGPDEDFFNAIEQALGGLPFIAEDLGEIGPEVYKLRDKFSLPGMKVIQFAFDENMPQSDHIPHNFTANFIAYTGTHDNNTVKGWFRQSADEAMQARIGKYVGYEIDEDTVAEALARITYSSVAKAAILPIQDVLNLDENSKMNSPGTKDDNWAWRLLPGQITDESMEFLKNLTLLFNRD